MLMFIIVLCLFRASLSGTVLTIPNNQTLTTNIDSTLNYTFTIKSNQNYVFLRMSSCENPKYLLSQNNTQIIPTKYYSWGNLYFVNKSQATININSNNLAYNYTMNTIGMDDPTQLPSNSLDISYTLNIDQMVIQFQPLKIGNLNITANYSVWVVSTDYDLGCAAANDALPDEDAGIIRLHNLSSQSPITLHISTATGNLLEAGDVVGAGQLVSLILNNEEFRIGVFVDGSSPVDFKFPYNQYFREQSLTILYLQNGFLMILAGVLIFGIISCAYLYYKRKYKDQQKFSEEIEVEIDDNGHEILHNSKIEAVIKGQTEQHLNKK